MITEKMKKYLLEDNCKLKTISYYDENVNIPNTNGDNKKISEFCSLGKPILVGRTMNNVKIHKSDSCLELTMQINKEDVDSHNKVNQIYLFIESNKVRGAKYEYLSEVFLMEFPTEDFSNGMTSLTIEYKLFF